MDSSIVVVSNLDGKKYKMVMKGDVSLLSVDKIKRYLHSATNIEPSRQLLRFNNATVLDNMLGSQIGLYDGAVLFLDVASGSFAYGGQTAAHLNSSQQQPVMTPSPMFPIHHQSQHQPQAYHHHNASAVTIAPSPIVGGRAGSGSAVPMEQHAVASSSRSRWDTAAANDDRSSMMVAMAIDREQRQKSEERRFQLERDMEFELTRLRDMQRQVEVERSDMLKRENDRIQQLRLREDDIEREAERLRDERRRLDISKANADQDVAKRIRETDNLCRRQQQEIEALQKELVHARSDVARSATAFPSPPKKLQPDECVARSLDILSQEFRLPRLQLDANYTCIINLSAEKVNLLLTFDPSTQRLFLYSTILNRLPSDPSVSLKLYETVLEGALLGRDLAGGGIGISLKNNLLLLSTSLDMRHADEQALGAVARPFVAAVQKWIDVVHGIMRSSGASPEPNQYAF